MDSRLRLVGFLRNLLARLSVKCSLLLRQPYLSPASMNEEHKTADGLPANRKWTGGPFAAPRPLGISISIATIRILHWPERCLPAKLSNYVHQPTASHANLLLYLLRMRVFRCGEAEPLAVAFSPEELPPTAGTPGRWAFCFMAKSLRARTDGAVAKW